MFSLTIEIIARFGVGGVFLLMLLENLVPIIPSELILPLAGFQAARRQFDPGLAVAAATLASVVGGGAWYALGRRVGFGRVGAFAERHGRWLPVTRQEVERANRWFCRWGVLAVCLGRALPGVRGVICIPAGMARMSLGAFILSSAVGSFAWSSVLVSSGYLLHAHYGVVQGWLDPVTDGVLAAFAGLYLFRVARRPNRG